MSNKLQIKNTYNSRIIRSIRLFEKMISHSYKNIQQLKIANLLEPEFSIQYKTNIIHQYYIRQHLKYLCIELKRNQKLLIIC